MKTNFLFVITLFFASNINAQWSVTDSLNLGEDSVSHGYMESGMVGVGTYTCGGDATIRVGMSSSGDYIQFNMAVTANTDSIRFELAMPWRGGGMNESPKLWIENTWNDTIPYLGIANCNATYVTFGGVSSMTGDGMVTVKILDSLPGYPMDGQYAYIKVFSKSVSGVVENKTENIFDVYPNPNRGIFSIRTSVKEKMNVEVYNAIGRSVSSGTVTGNSKVDLSFLPAGIYFIKARGHVQRVVIE